MHCSKDALTNFFGWMIQGILAGLAFTCLIGKRFCEPPYVRRSWETWWYDTSKQGIGAMLIHMTNVYLAPIFQGDPCTWYVINFLLDSTIGLLIVFIGIRLCQFLAKRNKWAAINFGEYDAPKSWIYQTCIYVGLMVIVKLITTLFIQMQFWDSVKDMILFVLSPFTNPKIEIFLFMLVIPFFVNILIFWVTDNFLMRHDRQTKIAMANGSHHNGSKPNLAKRVKIHYQINKDKDNNSESDALISDDEDLPRRGAGSTSSLDSASKRSHRTTLFLNA